MEHQISFQDLLSGKMYPELSAATKERISGQLCKPSAPLKEQTFLFLDLKEVNGSLLGASWETVSALRGDYTTLNTGESPNEEKESSLLLILDRNVPEKYYLSKRACAGILKRAEQQQKMLPDLLKETLMEMIGSDGCNSV